MKRLGFILSLIFLSHLASAQTVSRQITYINLSSPGGGTVSVGDTLEIRAVISVLSGTTIYKVKFIGAIPINTVYIPGSLAAKTNEGATTATNTGNYTDATGDDRAQIVGGAITMNLGQSAGVPTANGGSIQGGSTVPRFYTSSTIIQATYKVKVTAAMGSQVVTAGNSFSYALTSNGAQASYPLTDLGILVAPDFLCTGLDLYNYITDELGGTYYSGAGQNRISSPIVTGFTYTPIADDQPNDGYYTVVKNSSPTQYTGSTPASSDKVFGSWNVFGDHTGTMTAAGNPPAGAGQTGGFMLLVNASYAPSSVFTTTVSGLMTYSSYTFSFWIRNLCGNCSGTPTGGGGVGAGVLPNLLLSINGLDYYGSGDIPANNQWIQKSFTFYTGNFTTAAINVRNNAPGGGGNDWAIDDFTMYQCLILLPTNLTDFSAHYQSGTTQLKWNASKDDLISKYIVEYSADGKAFYTAGEVKPTGNGGKYEYLDSRTVNNKMYYRIMMMDKQGRSQYSKVLIVREQAEQATALKISPNPATANPTLSFYSESRQNVNVTILDASGRRVSNTSKLLNKGANSFTLSTPSQMSKGLYFVQVQFENGKMMTERLIIHER
jgi:hypothetical protein